MNKKEFNDMLLYLRTRPEEAKRLADALCVAAHEDDAEWVGAKEAADWLGKSRSWIKSHIEIFPSTIKVVRKSKFCYKFNKAELRPQYENFLRNGQG